MRLKDKVMDLNVKGVFNTTRVAAECKVARGKGHTLNFFHGEYFWTARRYCQCVCVSCFR